MHLQKAALPAKGESTPPLHHGSDVNMVEGWAGGGCGLQLSPGLQVTRPLSPDITWYTNVHTHTWRGQSASSTCLSCHISPQQPAERAPRQLGRARERSHLQELQPDTVCRQGAGLPPVPPPRRPVDVPTGQAGATGNRAQAVGSRQTPCPSGELGCMFPLLRLGQPSCASLTSFLCPGVWLRVLQAAKATSEA